MDYLIVEPDFAPFVALIRINRPNERNALNTQLMQELQATLEALDSDDRVRVIILTGNEEAFAAGADIKQMADKSAVDMLLSDQFNTWLKIRKTRKPVIAAVSGYCLGGGCELAMTCDMIIASETAQFGQPEIKIGVIPGAGGTQRLARAIGKAKTMELILTGRFIPAQEAQTLGIVNKVVPVELYLQEAVALAREIAGMAPVAARLAKESVNRAFETPLEEGLCLERQNFHLCFVSDDQKEGMRAFIEKRKPNYTGK